MTLNLFFTHSKKPTKTQNNRSSTIFRSMIIVFPIKKKPNCPISSFPYPLNEYYRVSLLNQEAIWSYLVWPRIKSSSEQILFMFVDILFSYNFSFSYFYCLRLEIVLLPSTFVTVQYQSGIKIWSLKRVSSKALTIWWETGLEPYDAGRTGPLGDWDKQKMLQGIQNISWSGENEIELYQTIDNAKTTNQEN